MKDAIAVDAEPSEQQDRKSDPPQINPELRALVVRVMAAALVKEYRLSQPSRAAHSRHE